MDNINYYPEVVRQLASYGLSIDQCNAVVETIQNTVIYETAEEVANRTEPDKKHFPNMTGGFKVTYHEGPMCNKGHGMLFLHPDDLPEEMKKARESVTNISDNCDNEESELNRMKRNCAICNGMDCDDETDCVMYEHRQKDNCDKKEPKYYILGFGEEPQEGDTLELLEDYSKTWPAGKYNLHLPKLTTNLHARHFTDLWDLNLEAVKCKRIKHRIIRFIRVKPEPYDSLMVEAEKAGLFDDIHRTAEDVKHKDYEAGDQLYLQEDYNSLWLVGTYNIVFHGNLLKVIHHNGINVLPVSYLTANKKHKIIRKNT